MFLVGLKFLIDLFVVSALGALFLVPGFKEVSLN